MRFVFLYQLIIKCLKIFSFIASSYEIRKNYQPWSCNDHIILHLTWDTPFQTLDIYGNKKQEAYLISVRNEKISSFWNTSIKQLIHILKRKLFNCSKNVQYQLLLLLLHASIASLMLVFFFCKKRGGVSMSHPFLNKFQKYIFDTKVTQTKFMLDKTISLIQIKNNL